MYNRGQNTRYIAAMDMDLGFDVSRYVCFESTEVVEVTFCRQALNGH